MHSGGKGEGAGLQVGVEVGEGVGHVFSAEAEADVAGLVVDGAGEEEDAGVTDELVAEELDVLLGLEAGKADGGSVGRSPIEKIRVAGEKAGEQREIVADNL